MCYDAVSCLYTILFIWMIIYAAVRKAVFFYDRIRGRRRNVVMSNLNSLNNCINYLLTGAQHAVFQYMKKNLARFDITPIQYGVLGCIWEFDMHNPKDIAAHLGVENSTISGILERMETKGLIHRTIDSADRRYIHIELTDISRDLELPVRTVVTGVDRVVLEQFDEKEVIMLKEMLRKINSQELPIVES